MARRPGEEDRFISRMDAGGWAKNNMLGIPASSLGPAPGSYEGDLPLREALENDLPEKAFVAEFQPDGPLHRDGSDLVIVDAFLQPGPAPALAAACGPASEAAPCPSVDWVAAAGMDDAGTVRVVSRESGQPLLKFNYALSETAFSNWLGRAVLRAAVSAPLPPGPGSESPPPQ